MSELVLFKPGDSFRELQRMYDMNDDVASKHKAELLEFDDSFDISFEKTSELYDSKLRIQADKLGTDWNFLADKFLSRLEDKVGKIDNLDPVECYVVPTSRDLQVDMGEGISFEVSYNFDMRKSLGIVAHYALYGLVHQKLLETNCDLTNFEAIDNLTNLTASLLFDRAEIGSSAIKPQKGIDYNKVNFLDSSFYSYMGKVLAAKEFPTYLEMGLHRIKRLSEFS